MTTISPHTTRAPGTILTATIYNFDHGNHIANAQALNSGKIEGAGSVVDGVIPVFDGVSGAALRSSGKSFPLGTADLADDSVTYAKLQNASATARILARKTSGAGDYEECTLSEVLDFIGSAAQGDILYRGASSWVRLGAGTSGQFLQTQGAAANPQWASTGGMVLLASGTLSGAASLDLVLTSYTAYRGFKVFASLLPATDAVALRARFSTNGGSSYDSGATDYAYMEHFGTEAGGHDQAESTGTAQITITGDVGNAAREGVMFEAILIDPFNASRDTRLATRSLSITGAGVAVHSESYGFRNTGQDTDAFQFLFSSGNMSGPYALYGIS